GDEALRSNRRLRARPWGVRTEQEYAAMLAARGDAGDRERARELAHAAVEGARELGMATILARAERVLTACGDDAAVPAAAPAADLRSGGGVSAVRFHARAIPP